MPLSRILAPFVCFCALLSTAYLQAEPTTESNEALGQNGQTARTEEAPLVADQNSIDYIQTLQRLYLTQQVDKVLLIHINNLLTDFSLRPRQQVSKTTLPPLIRYSLSHDKRGNLITSRQQRSTENQQFTITTTKIHVYGVDPFVSYRCSETSQSCWMRSPIHGAPWLEISKNEEGAKELAYAITLLIKSLQKEGQGKAVQ